MSTHLVGGGRDPDLHRGVYGPFSDEAAAAAARHGRAVAEVGVVVVHPDDEDGRDDLAWFGAALAACRDVACRPLPVVEGDRLDPEALRGLDGLLVAGGLTPAYAAALVPAAVEVRALVDAGVPYLGFSAGAAVAPGRALVGGHRSGGRVVTGEDNAEECDELTVVEGLGLVDLAVDVHAAQWGTVSRLVAAVAGRLVTAGVAVDEGTVLTLGDGQRPRVAGAGQVWWVEPVAGDAGAVRVRLQTRDG